MISPAASFFLSSVEHTLAETLLKFSEGGIIIEIICDKPSNYRSNSGSSVLFPFIVYVDDSTLGYGDVCCYLLGSETFKKFLRIISKEKLITGATLILK